MLIHPGREKLIRTVVSEAFVKKGDFELVNKGAYQALRADLLRDKEALELSAGDFNALIFSKLLTTPLQEIPEAGHPDRSAWEAGMVISIIEELQRVPVSYQVTITLPGIRSRAELHIPLSNGIDLVASETQPKGIDLLSQQQFRVALAIRVVVKGYHQVGTSGVTSSAGAIAKQVATMFLAANVMEVYYSGPSAQVFVVDDGPPEAGGLPTGLQDFFGKLQLLREHTFDARPEGPDLFKATVDQAQRFFAHKTDLDFRERIATAMEWYIDSITSPDETLGYLSACIGLESLLGDKNEIDSKRMQDRYGYLLGRSRERRQQLADDPRQVQQIRGNLVHARSSRLKARELESLKKVRGMLLECIRVELQNLIAIETITLANALRDRAARSASP